MLAAGTVAQTAYSAIAVGLAVIAPALRARYHLSLGQTGLLISAPSIGAVLSLLPWGHAADRTGERVVLVVGIGGAAAALFVAAHATAFTQLTVLLFVAGLAGASVNSASGRAVSAWFPQEQRGLALAVRQTAIPLSGVLTALLLPPLVRSNGVDRGFTALAVFCLVGAAVAGLVLRDVPAATEGEPVTAPVFSVYRSRPLWLLSIGSALVIGPQLTVTGFAVLFLHVHRALTPASAASVFAVVQFLAVGGRLAAGRWSDVVGSRVGPLRRMALALTVLLLVTAASVDLPLPVLVPVLVLACVVSMSWNSLSFAGAVELAGPARSGAAIGLQQTVMGIAGSAYPGLFGVLVAATSWRIGIVAAAALPLAGWAVLSRMRGSTG